MHDISHRLSEMALTICSILLAITTLTAEETPKDQLKRFQESIEAFKADIAKQKKLVEYPGEVRQDFHNSQWYKNRWYNLTEEQQKRLIRKNKLRAYPVCWSFEKFTSVTSSPLPFMECPELDSMFFIVESTVRRADGKYSDGHPTINFPDEVFPMKMLKDKKKLEEALDLYGKQTVYVLLVPQSGSLNLRQFYMENFEAPLKDKIKNLKKQLKAPTAKKKKDKTSLKKLEEGDDDENEE